jgi:PAS domain S-box-containing protein
MNTGIESLFADPENLDSGDVLLRALTRMFAETSNSPALLQPGRVPGSGGPNLQDRYRALVEQIPAVIFMAPLDGGLGEAYVSPQIEQAIGFRQEEWLGDPVLWYRQIHPDDKARWSAEAAQMLMTGNTLKSTYRVLSRDGRVIWFRCEVRIMRMNNGQPWFIHGVGFDVTDLKQTEESLQHERNFVSAILDTVGALVLVLDPEGHIIRWNRACEHITGYSSGELQDKYVWDIFMLPDDPRRFQLMLREAQTADAPSQHEANLLTRKGEQRLIAWSGAILPRRSGDPVYTIVTGIDITERKRLEQRELERQAAKVDETLDLLQRLIDSMSEGLLLLDPSGRIVRTNRAASQILRRKLQPIVGLRISDIFVNKEVPTSPFDPRFAAKGSFYLETGLQLVDGNAFPASLSCVRVNDKEDHITGLLLVVQDITERKQSEEMLRRTEKLATAGRLAASIAHEINNPLESVTNLLYLMKKNPSKVERYLELAIQELSRVIHISKQTLGFYRDTTVPVSVDIADLLENVLYLYTRRLESRDIRLETKFDRQANILAFAGEIRQVFSNLISNALDAMPSGGRLILKVICGHSWKDPQVPGIHVTVADTGMGIAPEHKKNIFEAFYTTKTDIGTGLGLWVTQGIIQKHKGSIRFRSTTRPGNSGTVFSVFLPQGEQDACEPTAS